MEQFLTQAAAPPVRENLGKWQLLDYQEDPKAGTRTLTVMVTPKGECDHKVTRHPDGTVSVNGSSTNATVQILLNQGHYARTLTDHISALLYAETVPHASHAGWQELFTNPWHTIEPVKKLTAEILADALLPSNLPPTKSGRRAKQPTVNNLTQTVNRIIRAKFLDPTAVKSIPAIFNQTGHTADVTPRTHNEALLNGPVLLELKQTTAPLVHLYATAILPAYDSPAPAGHPGQIIARIKGFLNFTPAQWKQLNRLIKIHPTPFQAVTHGNLDTITNSMADANRPEAHPQKIAVLMELAGHIANTTALGWQHGHPWKAWINILNQYLKDEPARNHRQEFQQVVDAFTAQIRDDLPWGPGNWETLVRRSERWHAQRRENPQWTLPQHVLHLSWHSQVQTASMDQITYNPVTTARELARLGAQMGNCLATYWDRCHHGTSRIFTAHRSEDNAVIAAVEIINVANGWIPGQIEAPARGRYPKAVQRHARTLARMYQNQETHFNRQRRTEETPQ